MFGIKKLKQHIEALQAEVGQLKNQVVYSSDSESMMDLFNVKPSSSGVQVNSETAMRASAVFGCVRLIAGTISTIPFPVYEKKDGQREKARDHKLHSLLNSQPNILMTAATYWDVTLNHVLRHGDGFSVIYRHGSQPAELLPINPSQVLVEKKNGRLVYYISMDGEYFGFDQDDILHYTGLGFNGLRSLSPIQHAAKETIGLSLAAEEYSARFFSNGARPDVVITYPQGVVPKAEQQEALRNSWINRHQGIDKSHLPSVLANGGDVKVLSVPAKDSQLIESRNFQISDIARIYGVPPHMIGHTEKSTSWGTGIEQQVIGFIKFTLQSYLTRIEQEVNRKLLTQPYFAKWNLEGLLRSDSKTRSEFYKSALGGSGGPAWMTPNEVRRIEDLPRIEGGDQLATWNTGDPTSEKQTD